MLLLTSLPLVAATSLPLVAATTSLPLVAATTSLPLVAATPAERAYYELWLLPEARKALEEGESRTSVLAGIQRSLLSPCLNARQAPLCDYRGRSLLEQHPLQLRLRALLTGQQAGYYWHSSGADAAGRDERIPS